MSFAFLNFRRFAIGGPAIPGRLHDAAGRALPWSVMEESEEVVFALHGFNVTESAGRRTLGDFAALVPSPLLTLGVLWPGDGAANALTYPFEEKPADDTATWLARTVLDHARPTARLNFIAHSLGCRVVLETMRRLLRHGRTAARVGLMAGAVDGDALARADRYRAAVRAAERVAILASRKDWVLEWAFPAGDFVASLFRGGYTAPALGYAGPTGADLPAHALRKRELEAAGVGHADYLPGRPPNACHVATARWARALIDGAPDPAWG